MKNIIENIFGFLYTLSMGDYVFFFGTFLLIISFIYILFLMKREEEKETNYEISDLESIKETIEREYKPSEIKLTEYEEEQEKNAIISYEELVKNKDNFTVRYDEDYSNELEDISVKKISLDENGTELKEESSLKVKLMNYDKEEAFLVALKQLQKNLSN